MLIDQRLKDGPCGWTYLPERKHGSSKMITHWNNEKDCKTGIRINPRLSVAKGV